jgi:D-xylose reductase
VDDGLVRNIGISNFNTQLITDLLTYARIKPAVLELELHPYLQQKRLIKWVKQQEINIIAYASFGNVVFDASPPHLEHVEKLLSHPIIKKIAQKNKLNVGQVALGWAVQHEYAVIPKSVNEDRMRSNLAVFDIKFDEADLQELEGLDIKARFNDFYLNNYGFEYPLFD